MNLSIFVIVPLLMLFGLWLARNDKQVRGVMVAGASVLLGLSIYLVFAFLEARETMPADQAPMLFTYCVPWFEPLHINYSLGVDGISVVMILLTSIIVFTGTFASWQMEPMKKEYFLWFTLLSIGVYGFFISIDMFTMFMFYEVALIPMYLLIGVWGSGAKEYSAMKLTLMLMGGSALLIIGILGIYFYSGAQTFEILDIAHHTNGAHAIPESVQNVFFPLLFIGFGILGALFPFHTWSPDGHASAPTAVSMLHAGVLMKLGGYGCFRIAMFLLPAATHGFWIKVFLVLTTISIVYGALSACVQTDLKYINAYSSVSHCGMVLFALCMMTETAATGAILQMLSHGLMTALFFAVIGMIYHQAGTRDVRYLGGLMKIIPFLSVGYAVAGLANLGLPGFSGFVAEMTIFVGSFQNADTFHRVCTIIACTSIVVTAVYILRCVGKILYQKVPNPKLEKLHDATWDERIAVAGLIACVAGLGMFPLWAVRLSTINGRLTRLTIFSINHVINIRRNELQSIFKYDSRSYLMVVLLITFIADFCSSKSADRQWFNPLVCLLMVAHIAINIFPTEATEAFGGMYTTGPAAGVLKTILALGTLIVMVQAKEWLSRKDTAFKEGEFYMLIISTLLGMNMMVSAGHFLMFFLGLEMASVPMACLLRSTNTVIIQLRQQPSLSLLLHSQVA